MRFNVGSKASAEASGDGTGAMTPVDFMQDPSWTGLVGPILHGEANPRSLAKLPRRDRDYVYRVVSHLDSTVSVERTQSWHREAPSSTTAALVGASKVRDARRIRRGRRLFDMTPLETESYSVILAGAESFLLNACTHYPDAVLPWIPRIDLARGLRLGHDEILRRFGEAQSREKWSFLAAEAAFTGLLPAWSGSYEMLFKLAGAAIDGTPAGHPVRSLAATAEAERIMKDRNLNLSLMPSRTGLDFTRLFLHYVHALPDDLDPDDVVGLGAFMFTATPRDKEEAQAVLRALTLLRGRCGGQPYATLKDPLGWFGRTLATREGEAKALLG